ncbi:tetratricopeptide repeat protein [Hymenobacter sp. 5317J-9]|uniref:tetratricopeptide repeat protein n=1 Tax=Hymenobacter sp. 5317J-9 TaxID=2932250 RepID=UPI001FD6CBDF|nr:tetratricopeptide repeat protein [Hymenobacter sp. 5317J-9]UOQ99016.1 tetratricopeptide repeat protein [Hymenobacter sp. 5317J-9]
MRQPFYFVDFGCARPAGIAGQRAGWWRGVLLAWLLLVLPRLLPAQQLAQPLDFQPTDSLTQTLATQYRWAELDSVGRAALRAGTDYPTLRRHLGQAALAREQPAQALRHYGRALRENPLDTAARYGLALAYLDFNQSGPAALLAGHLPDSLRRPLHLMPFQAVTQVEVEAGGQHGNSTHRGDAGFFRLDVSSRLGSRIGLNQNVSYFGQTVELPDRRRPGGNFYPLRQVQYHALLAGQLAPRWRVLLGYNHLNSDLGLLANRADNLGYASVAYARPYWTAQVGVYAGTLTDTARVQTDLRLAVYPLGNLRLYAYGRASVLRSNGRSYPHGVLGVGGRLQRHVWLEAYAGLGLTPVLAELDGTYVYNLLDPVNERGGANLLILLSRPLSLRLSYGAEHRRDSVDGRYYSLNSLSTALTWTW